MASSNIDQPWMFRSIGGGVGDSWYPTSDAFARETESALTKALQQSLFNNPQQFSENISVLNHPVMVEQKQNQQNNDYYYYTNNNNATASASTITVSGSGSEPETPGSRPTRGNNNNNNNNNNLGVMNGKTTKRKSRASKRSMTTFIQADPANFRQMVQQVTGVKFEGNGINNAQFPSVIKPETVRQPYINNKLQGLLPTLDTSAYLLDHHQSNNYRGSSGSGLTQDGGVGNDFYAFSCFPTLESSI
uniref:calmodulin-binding protein 25-like n=1 Tax=Erigeron canadensis TaxID=72917 RepID=UPI001CB992F3|nr:calmodulin-binding protein 25-like [Erigeron canadensis]